MDLIPDVEAVPAAEHVPGRKALEERPRDQNCDDDQQPDHQREPGDVEPDQAQCQRTPDEDHEPRGCPPHQLDDLLRLAYGAPESVLDEPSDEPSAVVEKETRRTVSAPIPKIVAGTIGLFLLVGTSAACSDDSSSSSDQSSTQKAQSHVCSNASDFDSSVNKLVDDVKSGNFGNAKDQLSNVESSFQALEKSVKNLSSTKKSSVQSELDSVKGTLDGLGSAASIDAAQSTLRKAESELKNVGSTITDTLSC